MRNRNASLRTSYANRLTPVTDNDRFGLSLALREFLKILNEGFLHGKKGPLRAFSLQVECVSQGCSGQMVHGDGDAYLLLSISRRYMVFTLR